MIFSIFNCKWQNICPPSAFFLHFAISESRLCAQQIFLEHANTRKKNKNLQKKFANSKNGITFASAIRGISSSGRAQHWQC